MAVAHLPNTGYVQFACFSQSEGITPEVAPGGLLYNSNPILESINLYCNVGEWEKAYFSNLEGKKEMTNGVV